MANGLSRKVQHARRRMEKWGSWHRQSRPLRLVFSPLHLCLCLLCGLSHDRQPIVDSHARLLGRCCALSAEVRLRGSALHLLNTNTIKFLEDSLSLSCFTSSLGWLVKVCGLLGQDIYRMPRPLCEDARTAGAQHRIFTRLPNGRELLSPPTRHYKTADTSPQAAPDRRRSRSW